MTQTVIRAVAAFVAAMSMAACSESSNPVAPTPPPPACQTNNTAQLVLGNPIGEPGLFRNAQRCDHRHARARRKHAGANRNVGRPASGPIHDREHVLAGVLRTGTDSSQCATETYTCAF